MTLEYLKEYRTYFHIANNYRLRESTYYWNIIWIEDALMKYKRKELLEDKNDIKVIL